ncbi:hypothetical protein JCM3775_006268 [Rhodotorula graminis]|uniref:Uncharacterized protein n=1 Tax=Rhodotorula graminis (strain WP1) TaxID=578459 RepID=A0A194S213_RHOGW|nr:uncharacterized protein RHOBADRAFT_53605 [Rhodotorula graminis WP1]KPV74642.1 hypothetical protein RHOBADRAFT_53605 [Rhodotorula graminis WP1]
MASTAADSRGHVRTSSIAQKRSNAASPRTPRTAPFSGGPDSPASSQGRSSTPDIPPRLAIRVIAAALALFLVLHYAPALLSSSSSSSSSSTSRLSPSALAHHARERKALRQGAPESWVLPRKWRDVRPGDGDVVVNGETLPACKRVMLFRMGDQHGFSSEMLHYARALVVANKLGYALLADDAQWNYGALSDYFVPRLVHCRPPEDWFSTGAATRVGTRRWQGQDRVWLGRETEPQVDEWIRDEMLDPNDLDDLRARKFAPGTTVLPEGETLPSAFEEVFSDFAAALKEVWRPNQELAALVRKQRMELGLGGGGLRHRKHSPTWGGNRRKGAAPVDTSQDDEEQDREAWELGVAERADRGPVVGLHLGGPKPSLSLSLFGLSPPPGAAAAASSFHVGDPSAPLAAAHDATRRLTHASSASPSYSRVRPTLFPPGTTATLVALTANSSAFDELAARPESVEFNVVRTSAPASDELARWDGVFGNGGASSGEGGGADRLLSEWDQKRWNDEVPRGLKVLLARHFARDLTTLSLYADAFIVSAASPTGRLALLLSGEEGAVGPRDFHGGSFGGRVRSVDAWWSPTARVQAVLGA